MKRREGDGLSLPVRLVGVVIVVGSWITLFVFALEAASIQLHWWTAPWGVAGHRAVLKVTALMAAANTILFGFLAWLWRKRWDVEAGDGSKCFDNSLLSLIYAAVGFWCASALLGFPSVALLWVVAATIATPSRRSDPRSPSLSGAAAAFSGELPRNWR